MIDGIAFYATIRTSQLSRTKFIADALLELSHDRLVCANSTFYSYGINPRPATVCSHLSADLQFYTGGFKTGEFVCEEESREVLGKRIRT